MIDYGHSSRRRLPSVTREMAVALVPFLLAFLQSYGIAQSVVREERKVVVGGVTEVWQLVWLKPPKPICAADDFWTSTPCNGFAFGEAGELDLVRLRQGKEFDRFHLTRLFGHDDLDGPTAERVAILQRWEVMDGDDARGSELQQRLSLRPLAKAMKIGDYNHDGEPTEFPFQIGEVAGARICVLIGVSKENRRLHLFGTARLPDKPLKMARQHWESLRDSTKPIHVLEMGCFDHGAESQSELDLSATAKSIHVVQSVYNCPEPGKQRKLIGRGEW